LWRRIVVGQERELRDDGVVLGQKRRGTLRAFPVPQQVPACTILAFGNVQCRGEMVLQRPVKVVSARHDVAMARERGLNGNAAGWYRRNAKQPCWK